MDEDMNVSYSFTDKLGHLVLTRQMQGSAPHDTYYVYDEKVHIRIFSSSGIPVFCIQVSKTTPPLCTGGRVLYLLFCFINMRGRRGAAVYKRQVLYVFLLMLLLITILPWFYIIH